MTSSPPPSDLLHTLGASSRPAGSAAEGAARLFCTKYLTQRGFHCQEKRFSYSAWPGRWATPACGTLLLLGAAIPLFRELPKLGFSGTTVQSLSGSILFLTLAICLGLIAAYFGTTSFPWLRTVATNLEAIRSPGLHPNARENSTPPIWLVAHLDSKSQPIPMALRVAAVGLSIVAWGTLLILWIISLSSVSLHPVIPTTIVVFAGLATLAALPLAFCTIVHKGTGALDNASGVAAVLAAIDQIDPDQAIGVLLTSAEELGLAGARAWVLERQEDKLLEFQVQHIHTTPDYRNGTTHKDGKNRTAKNHPVASVPPPIFLNCDSVDDRGTLTCMFPRRHVDFFREPLQNAEQSSQISVKSRRLIPGILVDAVAFSKAGWPALTVSRGDWHSLARIHSRDDNLAHMTGAGVESAAQFITALVHAIVASPGARRTS